MFMLIGLKRGCFFSKFETDNGDLILNKLSIVNFLCKLLLIFFFVSILGIFNGKVIFNLLESKFVKFPLSRGGTEKFPVLEFLK